MANRRQPHCIFALFVIVGLLLTACGAPQPTPLPPVPTAEPTQVPTATAAPTNTPAPTATLPPSATPRPTTTPAPTATPAPTKNIYELLSSDGQYSTLVTLIDQAQLKALLAPGPVTLFAPTNAAFDALGADQLAQLQADPQKLNNVLSYHIVPGRYTAKDLRSMSALTTSLPGVTLTVQSDAQGVHVNGTLVITADQETTSGVIHAIAGVLISSTAPAQTTAMSDTATITGTISYPQRIALAPNAVIEVQLADVTNADAPVQIIASQVITADGRQVPISFTVTYAIDAIDPAHTYSVNARITTDGKLSWINTQAYYVLTKGQLTGVDIMVEQATGTTAPTTSNRESITGTVTYLPRVALPPGSIVQVQLADVTNVGVPAQVIASQTITPAGGQAPIPFEIKYDPAQIDLNHTYALQAKIFVDGQLRWVTTQSYPVLTNNQPWTDVEIVVEQTGGAATNILTGTVTYREQIALDPSAVIKVQLLDVSLADAQATVISEQTINANGQQVPIPFALQADPSQIDPDHYYMLLTTITVNGELRWINHQAQYVLTHGNPATNVEVMVQPVE